MPPTIGHYYALIMAGGGGTRLWPLSRKNLPKQLLPLINDQSMFRSSFLRLAPLFSPDRIYVATDRNYVEQLRADVPEIPSQNFVVEPYGKNTGPAVGLAMTVIHRRDPQATVALLTADHHIARPQAFREVLSAAWEVAQQDYIVTLGIAPTFPATGFGYIRQGEEIGKINTFPCYKSRGFTEKPDRATAAEFLISGEYSWNSGMFIWKAGRALHEFDRQQPSIYAHLNELSAVLDTPEFKASLEQVWETFPSLSIDYLIMEGAADMAVIPVNIGWSDVGSWDALFGVLEADELGNCHHASGPDPIILDSHNTLVYSKRLVVTIGIQDVIVIDTDDVLLICRRDRSQDVRDVVNHLRETGNDRYL